MPSTLDRATEQLSRALIQFDDVLQGPNGAKGILALLGWDVPPAVDDIGLAAVDLSALIDKIAALDATLESGTATDLQIAEAYADVLVTAAAAITELKNLASGFAASATYLTATDIVKQFFPRLLDLLVIGGVRMLSPTATSIAQLCGVFVFEPHDADPTTFQVEHVRQIVRWNRLGKLLTDPVGLFRDVYAWGTSDFDAAAFIVNFGAVLQMFGAGNRIRALPRRAEEQLSGKAVPEADTHPALQLQISVISGLDSVAAGISLYGLRPTIAGGSDGGFGLSPYVQGTAEAIFPVSDRLSVVLDASVDISKGVAFLLRPGVPPAFRVDLASAVSGTAGATEQVALSLRYGSEANRRVPLISLPGGIQLLAMEVSAGGGLRSAGGVDAFVTAGIKGGQLALVTEQTDGFLKRILPSEGLALDFEFGLIWSKSRGLSLQGSAGLEAEIGLHTSIGPFTLRSLHVAIAGGGSGIGLETSITGAGVLGPVSASVDRIGLLANLKFQQGNLGPVDLGLAFKPPSGLGIVIDAGAVTGGGFITFDAPNGRYSGGIELKIEEVVVKAFGLLDTKLPDGKPGFSFLIIVTGEFTPVQLGFGFTLMGVGGLAGINRTMMLDALQAGFRAHSINSILFPDIHNAQRIISDLRAIFPPAEGRYVFGPMVEIGWGTPTLVAAQIGVILEIPAPIRLAILGLVVAALPEDEGDDTVVLIHLEVLGTVDFGLKKLAIDASIYDSRIVAFSLFGDMAMRLNWGADPMFAFSMGGLHPQFTPPPAFPHLRRLTLSIGDGDNPRLALLTYIAVTSNTVQFGADLELYAAYGGFKVHGYLAFDALFILSPFSFTTEMQAGVDVQYNGVSLAGIGLDFILTGPTPWTYNGTATLHFLFFSVSVGVQGSFGGGTAPQLPAAPVMDPLVKALNDARNWTAALPEGSTRGVSFLAQRPDDKTLYVHPMGQLTVRQTVVPLFTPITKFGSARPSDGNEFDIKAATLTLTGAAATPVNTMPVSDPFARAQYEDMSDGDKLAAKSYEPFPSGLTLGDPDLKLGTGSTLDLHYDTQIVDDLFMPSRTAPRYRVPLELQNALARQGAGALSPIWSTGNAKYKQPGMVSPIRTTTPGFIVADVNDLSIRYDITGGEATTQRSANVQLRAHLARHPEDAGNLQVMPLHEAAA